MNPVFIIFPALNAEVFQFRYRKLERKRSRQASIEHRRPHRPRPCRRHGRSSNKSLVFVLALFIGKQMFEGERAKEVRNQGRRRPAAGWVRPSPVPETIGANLMSFICFRLEICIRFLFIFCKISIRLKEL